MQNHGSQPAHGQRRRECWTASLLPTTAERHILSSVSYSPACLEAAVRWRCCKHYVVAGIVRSSYTLTTSLIVGLSAVIDPDLKSLF